MTIEHWVEYEFPGSLFSESETRKLGSRDVNEALAGLPKGAFAFRLFDLEIRSGSLEDGEKITNKRRANESGTYYPGGEVFTLEQVEQMNHPDNNILISNMRCNGWGKVVRTRRGNWQPLAEDATVFPYPAPPLRSSGARRKGEQPSEND